MNYPAASHGVSKARQQHENHLSGYGPAGQSVSSRQWEAGNKKLLLTPYFFTACWYL